MIYFLAIIGAMTLAVFVGALVFVIGSSVDD